MSKAEEITKKILTASDDYIHKRAYEDDCGRTGDVQPAFIEGAEWGYNQAEQDLMEKFKMWVVHNGYTAQESELVYNDFKQFITEN